MNQKVNVIVPVYNAEKYLKKCINCLVNQSYDNLKIILINDGSTDNSGEICDKYSKIYNNLFVIHQKNRGLSGARNSGLSETDGDYVTFLDPDDWIDSNYIKECMEEAEKHNFPDLIFTPYCREYGSKSIENRLFKKRKNIFFNRDDFLNNFYLNLFGRDSNNLNNPAILDDFSPVWSKFYKRRLLNNVTFVDTKKIGTEDLWFNINVLYKAQSALYVENAFYHYNKQNNNSLTKSYKEYLEPGWKELFKLIRLFITKNDLGPSYIERLNVRQGFAIVTLLREIVSSNTLNLNQKIEKAKKLLNDEFYMRYLRKYHYKKLSLKWKIFVYLCLEERVYSLVFLITFLEPLKKYLK